MRFSLKVALLGACAVTASLVDTAVATADDYIDFGPNQAACQSAARQANAIGNSYSYCYQTGPGHYSLYLAD
ncbi:hypothetical protein MAGR_65940 [Mycolicibacterium agri]|uniref:DUF732 domain-containing protein n=1 Tax=Mycolicibacterium agri TaxID=36811 RepID=A0A7I9WBP9_MYCAG|nr:hypothetical protein MAGR_65940 [Mycolicibacterium agri]